MFMVLGEQVSVIKLIYATPESSASQGKKICQFLVLSRQVIDLLTEIPNYGAEIRGESDALHQLFSI
jgi:hypothetical protein